LFSVQAFYGLAIWVFEPGFASVLMALRVAETRFGNFDKEDLFTLEDTVLLIFNSVSLTAYERIHHLLL